MIEPGTSLGLLVSEQPARAELFERLRLDYCCGGSQTLAQACERSGLDPATVCRLIEALEDSRLDRWHLVEHNDWRRVSIAELCDHIVTAHHDKLHDLQRLFAAIRRQLEAHMQSEERALFAACCAADAEDTPVDARVLAAHEQEHQATGDGLAALRELANDYDTAGALYRTRRGLLEALARLELDLHQHIHEENNVLFPRVRDLR